MKIFNFINLGEFHHTYKIVAKKEKTEIIQTVSFEPKGLGKLLKNAIVKSFKKRLPDSFDKFQKYVEVKI